MKFKDAGSKAIRLAVSPLLWMWLLFTLSIFCIVQGVSITFGVGPAYIVAGLLCMAAVFLIGRGLNNG